MNEKLMEIEKVANKYGESIINITTDEDITKFEKWLNVRLSQEDLSEYLSFINETNGFEFNGMIVYSIKLEAENNIYDANKVWTENADLNKYIFIADNDITWYCYDITENYFCELDKPSGQFITSYNNFNEMLEVLLALVV